MRPTRSSPLLSLTRTIPSSPSDASTGGGAAPYPVAEIVVFRLSPGISETGFLTAAKATEGCVAAQRGFVRRSLSRDDSGQWTDYVEWEDMHAAEAAAQAVMQAPEFAAFAAAIDPGSMTLSHRRILWQMGD